MGEKRGKKVEGGGRSCVEEKEKLGEIQILGLWREKCTWLQGSRWRQRKISFFFFFYGERRRSGAILAFPYASKLFLRCNFSKSKL